MTDQGGIPETIVACSACGNTFRMSSDYLAQYGGQETTCPCGATVAIPTTPVLAYRAPSFPPESIGAYADRGRVVLTAEAVFPQRCCVCNEPVVGRMHPHPLLWIIRGRNSGQNELFGNRIAYGQEGIRVILSVGYCAEHRWRRYRKQMLAGVCLLAAVLDIVGISFLEPYLPNIVGLIVGLAAIPMLFTIPLILMYRGPFKIAAARNGVTWITGFGPAYVKSLPRWADVRAAHTEAIATQFGHIGE